jgi:hypothetical protein
VLFVPEIDARSKWSTIQVVAKVEPTHPEGAAVRVNVTGAAESELMELPERVTVLVDGVSVSDVQFRCAVPSSVTPEVSFLKPGPAEKPPAESDVM